jgi:hypothetical protein
MCSGLVLEEILRNIFTFCLTLLLCSDTSAFRVGEEVLFTGGVELIMFFFTQHD